MKGIKKKTVLTAEAIRDALDQMVGKMVLDHQDLERLVLIGIRTGGAFLAERIRNLLQTEKGITVPTGALDITLYRDDWTRINHKPIVGKTEVPVSLDNKEIILVDDVLYTGRTVRAAMDALIDFGRPKRISLAVLVDRGGRELPISADYSGVRLDTKPAERVNVYLRESGTSDQVVVEAETEGKN
jgi:pyrimidine operon attenuation protein/uracil phosphoribosyltransferase